MCLMVRLQIGSALVNLLINSTTITVSNPKWDPANPDAAPRQIEEKAFWHEVTTICSHHECAFQTFCVCVILLMQPFFLC